MYEHVEAVSTMQGMLFAHGMACHGLQEEEEARYAAEASRAAAAAFVQRMGLAPNAAPAGPGPLSSSSLSGAGGMGPPASSSVSASGGLPGPPPGPPHTAGSSSGSGGGEGGATPMSMEEYEAKR